MKTATAVITLFAACLLLFAPTHAAAQSCPDPSTGGSCSQVTPGSEGGVVMPSNPLQSLLSMLGGNRWFAAGTSASLPETRTPAFARSSASARTSRYALQRHAAYGRTSR